MNTLAIILARGGSKGLPNKNALPVAGKPMLAWTLEHALASRRPMRVILSTDNDLLANIAGTYGIDVVRRPIELANDTATVDSAARHAVETIEREHGVTFDAAVLLYGNVPVRPPDLTDRALAKLEAARCDSVQSVCPVGKMHPCWMQTLVSPHAGSPMKRRDLSRPHAPEERSDEGAGIGDILEPYQPNTVYRRQDLPPVYMLDGGVITVTRSSLFHVEPGQPHAFLGKDRRAIVTQPGEVIDVDNEIDRRVAEAILIDVTDPV